jgi:hypothetical protein
MDSAMNQELQKYYEERFSMMATEGWQDLLEDIDNMIEPLIKKGYRCKIFNVLNYLCWGTPNDYKTYQYWDEHFRGTI